MHTEYMPHTTTEQSNIPRDNCIHIVLNFLHYGHLCYTATGTIGYSPELFIVSIYYKKIFYDMYLSSPNLYCNKRQIQPISILWNKTIYTHTYWSKLLFNKSTHLLCIILKIPKHIFYSINTNSFSWSRHLLDDVLLAAGQSEGTACDGVGQLTVQLWQRHCLRRWFMLTTIAQRTYDQTAKQFTWTGKEFIKFEE